MTTVRLIEDHDAYVWEAEGHATGSPESCAAVSMLMTMAANWTVANEYDGEQILEDGHAVVRIPKSLRGAKTVSSLLQVGFESLERAKKNYVQVEKKVQSLGKI